MAVSKEQIARNILNSTGPQQQEIRAEAKRLGGSYLYLLEAVERTGVETLALLRSIREAGIPVNMNAVAPNPTHRPEGLGLTPDGMPLHSSLNPDKRKN